MVSPIQQPSAYNLVSYIEELLTQAQTRAITKHAFHVVTLDQNVDVLSKASMVEASYNYMRIWKWECYVGTYSSQSGARYIEADTIPLRVRLNHPASTPIEVKKNMVLRAPFTKLYFEYQQTANPVGVTPTYATVTLFFGMNVTIQDEILLQQILAQLQQMGSCTAPRTAPDDAPVNVTVTTTSTEILSGSLSRKTLMLKVDPMASGPVAVIAAPNGATQTVADALFSSNQYMRIDPGESIDLSNFIGAVWGKFIGSGPGSADVYVLTLK
jgi:hypothetical protein